MYGNIQADDGITKASQATVEINNSFSNVTQQVHINYQMILGSPNELFVLTIETCVAKTFKKHRHRFWLMVHIVLKKYFLVQPA